jgi:antibiotic biosynthesis monooxygenase (ABM) superfamily enzyme
VGTLATIFIDSMITCFLKYTINPYKLREFEVYAKKWIPLVNKFGGKHHGYFLPHEGANNIATALFSFDSLAAYEKYREDSLRDDDCQAAYQYAIDTQCILHYERSFMKPIFS